MSLSIVSTAFPVLRCVVKITINKDRVVLEKINLLLESP